MELVTGLRKRGEIDSSIDLVNNQWTGACVKTDLVMGGVVLLCQGTQQLQLASPFPFPC